MPNRPKPLVDVVYVAHPSGFSIPADIVAIQTPISIAVGTNDLVLPLSKIEQIRELLAKKSNVPHEVETYEAAIHGFAARADALDEKQAEDAEIQAVDWFTKLFGEWKPT